MTKLVALAKAPIALAFTLGIALALGASSPASAQMTEGTWSGSYAAFGTLKATPVGKEHVMLVFDENGLYVSNGFLNHTTWHCWGLGDVTNGVGQDHGSCVGTDPAGDKVALNWSDDKHAADQKTVKGSFTLTAGTGKYTGITGVGYYEDDGAEFRPAVDGTYFGHNTSHGSYKLPRPEG